MAKVYVSSTFIDLKGCRARVNLALRKVGHEDVAMEYYVAGDERPVERCLADVAACDLYVGLFAWRYGYVPEQDNPEGLSITEMEYRQARQLGKHCLVFLLSEDAPWPRKFMDKDDAQIERLRAVLSAQHLTGSFTSAEDIAEAVYPAVYRWSEEHGHLPRGVSIPDLDLTAYFNALTRRYQHLDLDALTPPQRDENLRQRLREIFIEQNVRENPPPVELPKEVWEKLQGEREVHPEDLPAGVTPEDILRARESYFEKPSRPVLEALTDPAHRRAVVLGDPGSGKSTLARYLLLSLLGVEGDEKLRRTFESHLPLLVELRSYAGLCSKVKDSSFLDFIEHMSESEGWGLDRKALEHYLREDGRAVVVFDGLDEIFDPEERESAARRIAGFAERYPKARVVVTSRVIGYRRKVLTDADFSHFTLQDLDERQVEQFIDRWYALALDERPEEARARRERIMRSFKDSPSIRQLAGNPMLLTIMAIIGKNQELPRERWKLYDHAAGVLIYHWDVERHLRDRHLDAPFIGEEEKKELLRRLAYKMQSGAGGLAGNYIHRDALQREFETYLSERFAQSPADATTIARAMIDQFRSRNFILSLHGANLYGFVHRAFLEFFCASAFVQKFEKTHELTLEELKRDVYGTHYEEQTWHEVLRLICGMIDEKFAGEIISYLTNEVGPPVERFDASHPWWNISLALGCLSELRSGETTSLKLLDKTLYLVRHGMFSQLLVREFIVQHIVPHILNNSSLFRNEELVARWVSDIARSGGWPVSVEVVLQLGEVVGILGGGFERVKGQLLSLLHEAEDAYKSVALVGLAAGWPSSPDVFGLLNKYIAAKTPDSYLTWIAAMTSLAKYFAANTKTFTLIVTYGANHPQSRKRRDGLRLLSDYFQNDARTLPLLQERAIYESSQSVQVEARWLANRIIHKKAEL
jgi:GTPase SAR1 family protein